MDWMVCRLRALKSSCLRAAAWEESGVAVVGLAEPRAELRPKKRRASNMLLLQLYRWCVHQHRLWAAMDTCMYVQYKRHRHQSFRQVTLARGVEVGPTPSGTHLYQPECVVDSVL